MKRTTDSLAPKDKALLIDLYETEQYNALKKLIQSERRKIAEDCLVISTDQLRYLQGQAHALKQLHLTMKQLYAESQKNDQNKS